MRSVIDAVTNLVREEEGAALVEYGMLVLLIAVLCIVAIQGLGKKVSNGFDTVNNTLP
jgi:pilus assembly protein Flp/PilA